MGARLAVNDSVVIAISAFRSDEAVIRLLEAIFAAPLSDTTAIAVVDSLGSGAIEEKIATEEWPVLYENSERNLGSAGNLARRIELAADSGADWCFCLNHDASWSSERLVAMLKVAKSRQRIGAVYPILDHSPRKRRWEDGRRNFTPSAGNRLDRPPRGNAEAEVLWSSSNSALYATAPLREGVRVMDGLWMGYEDLAYGIALSQAGWLQLMCREAVLPSVFDYGKRNLFGREVFIHDKPTWYSYYSIRNLLLIRRHYGAEGISSGSILRKLVQSTLRILLLEDRKVTRLILLYKGTFAGLLGHEGKASLVGNSND